LELNQARYRDTRHWHDHFELEILDRGSAIHLVNCQSYQIKQYDAYLVTPADIHTLHACPDAPSSNIAVIHLGFNESAISDNLFNELMELKQPIHASLDETSYQTFRTIFRLLREESRNKSEEAKRMQKHLFSYLLLKFIKLYREQAQSGECVQSESRTGSSKNLQYINKAISYIKYNFRDPKLTTKKVAQAVYLSPNYFGEIFNKYMGVSCLDYIRRLKMDFAVSLLTQSNITVAQVSEKSGYSSISYFISDFKSEFGITPQKYREQMSDS
jgi:AraC-like DNA-binding protein